MIEERLAWEFETVEIREQLQRRNKNLEPWQRPKILDFEAEELDKMPPPSETVEDVLEALRDLGTERQMGFGIGPIPITAIWAYFEHRGYDARAVDLWTRLVLRADATWLALRAKKASE